MFLLNTEKQLRLDAHNRHVQWLRRHHFSDETDKRSADEWNRVLLFKAGWDATAWLPRQRDGAQLNAQQAIQTYMSGGTMKLKTLSTGAVSVCPGQCAADGCVNECVSTCWCGESYCSRRCLAKDWSKHRNTCEQVYENHRIGFMFNNLEFSTEAREFPKGLAAWGFKGGDTPKEESKANIVAPPPRRAGTSIVFERVCVCAAVLAAIVVVNYLRTWIINTSNV
jgi:hypothetical protein